MTRFAEPETHDGIQFRRGRVSNLVFGSRRGRQLRCAVVCAFCFQVVEFLSYSLAQPTSIARNPHFPSLNIEFACTLVSAERIGLVIIGHQEQGRLEFLNVSRQSAGVEPRGLGGAARACFKLELSPVFNSQTP